MGHEKALSVMSGEVGTKFDPELAKIFFAVIEHSEARAVKLT